LKSILDANCCYSTAAVSLTATAGWADAQENFGNNWSRLLQTDQYCQTTVICKLDGCIVWNVHNTLFGSKRSAYGVTHGPTKSQNMNRFLR